MEVRPTRKTPLTGLQTATPHQLQHLSEPVLPNHRTAPAPTDTQATLNLCPNRKPRSKPHGKAKATTGVTLRHRGHVVIQNGVLPPLTPKKMMRRTAPWIHPPATMKSAMRGSATEVTGQRKPATVENKRRTGTRHSFTRMCLWIRHSPFAAAKGWKSTERRRFRHFTG